jgi:hypothetical protein
VKGYAKKRVLALATAVPYMRAPVAVTRAAFAFIRNPWQAQETRMNRLLSLFKRRPTLPTSASFFSTNSPRLSLTQQSNMSPAGAVHPPSSSASPEKFENFDLIERVKLGISDITVSSWRSRVTGLSVVHLDYEGERTIRHMPSFLLCASVFTVPDSSHREWLLCGGYRKYANPHLCEVVLDSRLAVFNDSGCPHTLEQ